MVCFSSLQKGEKTFYLSVMLQQVADLMAQLNEKSFELEVIDPFISYYSLTMAIICDNGISVPQGDSC